MQNIEQTIVELGEIFQQFAHMVKEQEEMVGRLVTGAQLHWDINGYQFIIWIFLHSSCPLYWSIMN
jgi:hypothetical protein